MFPDDFLTPVNSESSLYRQAKLTEGCISVVNEMGATLELCWHVKSDDICVNLKLSAFGQNANLGNTYLRPHQRATLTGKIDNVAKSEIELSLEPGLSLCFHARVCVKLFIGNWHCTESCKLCIQL